MSGTWKNQIEISIFGESHGEAIGIILGNLPSGIVLDWNKINWEMKRRAPGQSTISTARNEADQVEVMSGLLNNTTTGAPLMAMIKNQDKRSRDYSILESHMRPGHSDYPAYIKYHGFHDVRGGGHFSGRLTAPIVFAGAVAKQILEQKGVKIFAHILSIQELQDQSFDVEISESAQNQLLEQQYPVLDQTIYPQMVERIEEAKAKQDSVGGRIECAITGVPAGVGEPFFDSIESHLAQLLFSIPAVKGVEFGSENIDLMWGSKANDAYMYKGDQVVTTTNHNGGILGGISNGMPILFRTTIKPTPSISREQQTVNVKEQKDTTLKVEGRHDPCIVPRAVVVVEAMAALCMLDYMRYL